MNRLTELKRCIEDIDNQLDSLLEEFDEEEPNLDYISLKIDIIRHWINNAKDKIWCLQEED